MNSPKIFVGVCGIFILVCSEMKTSDAEHIVFLQHMGSHSHLVATWNFAEALVSKGHNVTYITSVPLPSKNSKVSHIMPQHLNKFFLSALDTDMDVNTRLNGLMPKLFMLSEFLNAYTCDLLLQSRELQSWLNTTSKVDLIYVDTVPDCAYGLAYKLESKVAIFSAVGLLPKLFDHFGIVFESSSIPSFDDGFKTPMSIFQRVKTTLLPFAWRICHAISWNRIQSYTKKHLALQTLPSFDELKKNVSIILTNSHFLDEYRRALPPFVVLVPGMHVKETHDPLSKELENFINSTSSEGKSSEGFIYISLGTVAKASKLPQSIREVFYNSIKAFPEIRFLWRWDGEVPTDIPENLKLSKWFSQQDLLGHPKIKGFVTQAGRPSTQEAIYNAVPVITFPILGDQDYNAHLLESLGVAISLEIVDVTEEQLTNAFRSLLYDPKLKERSKEVSLLYKDSPMKPIDTAVWWTEYILRHKDTSHLKPLAIDQTWYQLRLLDVWAIIIIASLIFTYILYATTCFVCKIVVSIFISITQDSNKLKML